MLPTLTMLLWLPIATSTSNLSVYSYTINEQSWVSLSGSSNVNSFECYSSSKFAKGNLTVKLKEREKGISFSNALMNLSIKSFDCKNPILNKDLYEALGADDAPYISIELIDATPTRQMQVGNTLVGTINATMAITINSKCKMVEVLIDWQRTGPDMFRFTGSKVMNMTDFDITPPSPAFGLIKVDNKISINFSMMVEASSVLLADDSIDFLKK